MKSKQPYVFLFYGFVSLSVLLLAVLFLLRDDSAANTMDVRLMPGTEVLTIAIDGVQEHFQYSLDDGATWQNVPRHTTRIDNVSVTVGQTIIVRDTANAGFSQALIVTEEDLQS